MEKKSLPAATGRPGSRKQSFLWQAVLILLPVALTETTVRLMKPYATEKGVKLELETRNDPQPAATIESSVEGRALQQALVNLIDNAVKHSTRGQAVTVGIERRDGPAAGMVRLFVSDHGPGIPAVSAPPIPATDGAVRPAAANCRAVLLYCGWCADGRHMVSERPM
jgi:signal transduction histidine kinase